MIDNQTATMPTLETLGQHPERLMRVASVARAMLKEARATPCDPAGCEHFREIYERTLDELNSLLPAELRSELSALTVAFDSETPSPSEVRVAQAELVGWLEGLFNGIAAAAMSQQAEAQQRAEAMAEVDAAKDDRPMPGQYL